MGLIYQATNLLNGKRYIGRTTRTLSDRKAQYKHGAINQRHDSPLHRAMSKYGFNMFRFAVLLRCDDREHLCMEERRLIGALKPEYNALSGHAFSPKRPGKLPRQRHFYLPSDWSLSGEEWRPVVGYEGLYEVSDQGRMRCLPGKQAGKEGRGKVAKIARFHRYGHRAHATILTKDGERRRRMLHTLVLEAFVGPRPSGMLGCHKDDNKDNNRLGNLYWGTPKQNAADAVRNGKRAIGEAHHATKLTAKQVGEIRTLKGALSRKTIAMRFGVSLSTVADIHSGRYWRQLTPTTANGYIARGVDHYKARLTDKDIISIRTALADGIAGAALAGKYGVTYRHIRRIANRDTWGHI